MVFAPPVPLKGVEVQLEVKDHVASVVSTLHYDNKEDKPIEAVFVFPLPGDAAVCHFSATVGSKQIVAEVKEKQQVSSTTLPSPPSHKQQWWTWPVSTGVPGPRGLRRCLELWPAGLPIGGKWAESGCIFHECGQSASRRERLHQAGVCHWAGGAGGWRAEVLSPCSAEPEVPTCW